MVARLALPSGSRVLDVACGTGSITRELARHGHDVISLDQSPEMIGRAAARGATAVLASGDRLPFGAGAFDGVTLGYLLRYVDDVRTAVEELCRVVRPGGRIGIVEFGRPPGLWRPLWHLYTRLVLPVVGRIIGSGWHEVGRFLGPSIDEFVDRCPPGRLVEVWRSAGLTDVRYERMSLGGGLLMWGTVR